MGSAHKPASTMLDSTHGHSGKGVFPVPRGLHVGATTAWEKSLSKIRAARRASTQLARVQDVHQHPSGVPPTRALARHGSKGRRV